MASYTRTGRMALEEAFKDPGHWHIEGWCAVKENTRMWAACDGGCLVIGSIEQGARMVYATSLNAMRDRIRDEIAG